MIPLFSFYLKSRVFSIVLNILRKCIFLSQWHCRVCFFNVRLCNLKLYPLVELQVVKLQDLKGIFLKMSINITKWPTSHVGGLSLLPFQLAWSSSLKNTTLPTYQVNIAILICISSTTNELENSEITFRKGKQFTCKKCKTWKDLLIK